MNQGLFLCYICYVFDERPLRATGVTWHYCTCWLQACIGVGIIVVTMGPKFYRCLDLEGSRFRFSCLSWLGLHIV
nr:hypothetical protein CFP56_10557 [Quercus suber]